MRKHSILNILKILSFVALYTNYTLTFINYTVLAGGDPLHHIALLGDVHNKEFDKLNKLHAKSLKKYIKLNNQNFNGKLKIIFEADKRQSKHTRTYGETFKRLLNFEKKYSNVYDGIAITSVYPRGKESDIINGTLFTKIFRDMQHLKFSNLQKWERKKTKFIEWINDFLKLTLTDLKKCFKTNISRIMNWLDHFNDNTLEFSIFAQGLESYKKGTLSVLTFLALLDNDANVTEYLFKILDNCESLDCLQNKYKELRQMFGINTDYIIEDLGLMDEVIKAINNNEDVILIAGKSHTDAIVNFLHSLNYVMLQYSSILEEENGFVKILPDIDAIKAFNKNHIRMVDSFFTKQFSSNDSGNLDNTADSSKTLGSAEISTSSNTENMSSENSKNTGQGRSAKSKKNRKRNKQNVASINETTKVEPIQVRLTCNACTKTKPELLQCARCKKVFYCDAGCQKKDWPIHKLGCKSDQ